MIRKVALTLNPVKEGIHEKAALIIKLLKEKGITVFVSKETGLKGLFGEVVKDINSIKKEAELIISLGGDGTLFRTARDFSVEQIPLLGINVGGLGFLTEIPIENFKEGLESILSNNYRIEKRLMLQAFVVRKGKKIKSFTAFNDVVIGKSSFLRIVSLKTLVSGELVTTYLADGLIISTPTGSTAYSLSAGGPIVHPSLKAIILSPICAHTLAVRPLIVSSEEKIKVIPKSPHGKTLLSIDGQIEYLLEEGDEVEIEKSPHEVKLIRLKESSFFKILRTKLGWSGVSYK